MSTSSAPQKTAPLIGEQPGVAELAAIREQIAKVALRTPLLPFFGAAPSGSNGDIRLKPENLQPSGAFKIRGAVNALAGLSQAATKDGIYTASAGNFGQGLAYAGRMRGLKVRVHVPHTAAQSKLTALEALGATIISHSFDDWWQIVQNGGLESESGHFIHPFAERAVVLGNATIGLEIVEDWPDVETILVPFGGGGLALGIAIGAKSLKPSVKVIAVESEAATPFAAALVAGHPVTVPFDTSTFITGIGATSVSPLIWPDLQKWIDGARVVPVAAVADAVRSIAKSHHLIAEGAGGAALAAALAYPELSKRAVAVISGGHIDASVLAAIVDEKHA